MRKNNGRYQPDAAAASSAVAGLESEEQKVSYIMGLNIGSQINTDDLNFDIDAFNTGIKDALASAEPRLTEEETQSVIEAFQAKLTARQETAAKVVSEANLQEGDAFLAEKAKTEGVVVLDSGFVDAGLLKRGQGQYRPLKIPWKFIIGVP